MTAPGSGQSKGFFGKGFRLAPLVALVAALVVALFWISEVQAASFGVDTALDENDGSCSDGDCSLRDAIILANSNGQADTIALTVPGPYNLTLGQLDATSAITLTGNGETISAGGLSRIFNVGQSGNLSLEGVTLRDGMADAGGAILNGEGGTVNILNSAVVSNMATVNGGGIATGSFFNGGVLNIANSTISGNVANDNGGGLYHFNGFGGSVTNLTHVTISGNRADLNNQPDGSTQDNGGGIYVSGLGLVLKNSVVAGNLVGSSGDSTEPDCFAVLPYASQGYNFIGVTNYFTEGVPNSNNDFVGTPAAPLDPNLDNLAGSPPYHALVAPSLAIDQVPAGAATFLSSGINPLFTNGAAVATDQRGASRGSGTGQGGNGYDIGAYECDSIPTAIDLVRFEVIAKETNIQIEWETATEVDTLGFSLYRSNNAGGEYSQLNDTLIPSQSPGSPTGSVYVWPDKSVKPGITYHYKLKVIDARGRGTWNGPVSISLDEPATPSLPVIRAYLPLVINRAGRESGLQRPVTQE